MDVSITTSSTDAEGELRSLFLWLREDSYLRRNARVGMGVVGPAEGRMGALFDSVELALNGGFQFANLALAWASWRATRPRPPEVTFERDGVKVTLSGQDAETAARLLAVLDRP